MRTFFKSTVIGLIAFALTFSPTLAGLANAGGIHFEGVSAANSMYQARGIMFDFSFGGPDDYKKKSAFKEVYKNNFAGVDWLILGAGVLTVAVLVLDDDDSCRTWDGPSNGIKEIGLRNGGTKIPAGYCNAGDYWYPSPQP